MAVSTHCGKTSTGLNKKNHKCSTQLENIYEIIFKKNKKRLLQAAHAGRKALQSLILGYF